jgi:hypothetical protein
MARKIKGRKISHDKKDLVEKIRRLAPCGSAGAHSGSGV